jgi:hypothetical protein
VPLCDPPWRGDTSRDRLAPVARAESAVLEWVKPGPSGNPGAVSGAQGSRARLVARSTWESTAPHRFTVWQKAWWRRLARILRLTEPAKFLLVQKTSGNVSRSAPWHASTPRVPGQAQYYFEDDAPSRNRSDLIMVTTAHHAVRETKFGFSGEIAEAGPEGLIFKVPLEAGRQSRVYHELSAEEDPEVSVSLLYPGGERDPDGLRDHDLLSSVVEWLGEGGLRDRVHEVAEDRGVRGNLIEELQAITDGYLDSFEGWEVSLDEGDAWNEAKLSVGPGESSEFALNINPPSGGGRTSVAVKATDRDDPSRSVIGPVIELEATENELRIGEDPEG